MTIGWDAALAWRLERQFLGDGRADSVADVVRRLVAVPSWTGDATLAIALRREHPEPGDLDRARADGRVITTFTFRGSMQLMVPDDAGDCLALRAAGRQWELPSWREYYGLGPDDWTALREAVREALADGPLTQSELGAAVTADKKLRHLSAAFANPSVTLLKPLCWQGDMSIAPSRDGQLTFQSLEGIPGWSGIPPLEEAGPRAVLAYLAAYGPAPADRVQYWLGEGLSAGKKRIEGWIAGLGERLTAMDVDGVAALAVTEHVAEIAATKPVDTVRLLPGLDQWVLGAGTSDPRVVPTERRQLVTRGANLIVVGGRVAGTWKMAGRALTASLFAEAGEVASAELEAQTRRISALVDQPLELKVERV
jgi:hypothetical protein